MTIFNRFLNLDTNKCFMMSDVLGQTAGSGTAYSGDANTADSNGRDEMFYFLANQKFHTDMFSFDLEHKETDREEYVEFIYLIKDFTENIQGNYCSNETASVKKLLSRWVLHSSEFLNKVIVPSLKDDGTIDQETFKEEMEAIFKKDYNSFNEKNLKKLVEIASKHISPIMIEKSKLYVAFYGVDIKALKAEIEYSKVPVVQKIREFRRKHVANQNLTDEEVASIYKKDLKLEQKEVTEFTRAIDTFKKAKSQKSYIFSLEKDIKKELLKQLPLSKISDYLVAIETIKNKPKKINIGEVLKKIGVPQGEIAGLIASSREKIGNGIQYKSEDIAFDPSFVPIESSYSKEMKENVKFQLEACQKIEDEGIDEFPLAKLIYGHMKNFDSSDSAFDGSEQHLFRFFGSQFKNYTNYVESFSGKSFSIQGFLNFLKSKNNKIPGNAEGKAYNKLNEDTLAEIGKILYAQFGDIDLSKSENREFFEANLRLMHNAAAYHCYSPKNGDERSYRPLMNDFYKAYLFPTPKSIEVIEKNIAIKIARSSKTEALKDFNSEDLISPLLDFIKAKQKKPMSMLDGQNVSSFKDIMSRQPEYTKSTQFSPLILPFGITFTSLTENQRSTVSSMISSAMERQNAVIHSNGDTGSGKTFTKDVISLIINIGNMKKLPSVAIGETVHISGNTTFELVSTEGGKFNIKTIGASGTVVGTIDPSLKLQYKDQQLIKSVHQISVSLLELSGLKPDEVKNSLTDKVKQSVTGVIANTPEDAAGSLQEIIKPELLKDQYFILSADEFYQLDPSQQDAIREWQIENQSKFNVCLNCIGATPGIMFNKILEPTGISSRPDETTVSDNIKKYITRVEGIDERDFICQKTNKGEISNALENVVPGKNILCLPDLAEGDIINLAESIVTSKKDITPVFFKDGTLCYINSNGNTTAIKNPDEIPAEIRGKKILLMFGADRYIGGDAKEFSRNVNRTLIVSKHKLSLNRLKQAVGRNRTGEKAKESLYVDVPGITSRNDLINEVELIKFAVIEEWINSVKEARYEMKIFLLSMFDNISNEGLNFLVDKYISIIKENPGNEKKSRSEFIHYLENIYAKKVEKLSSGKLIGVKCEFTKSILKENPRIFSNIFKLFDAGTLKLSFQGAYGTDTGPIQPIITTLSEKRLEAADLKLEIEYLKTLKANTEDNPIRAEEIEGKISELKKKMEERELSLDDATIDKKLEEARPRELFYWVNIELTREDDAEEFHAIHRVFSESVDLKGEDKRITDEAFRSVIIRQEEIEKLRKALQLVGKALNMEISGDVNVGEIKKLQQEIEGLEKRVKEKDTELEKQLAQNKTALAEAQKANTGLQEQLKQAKTDYENKVGQLQKEKTELDQAKAKLEELQQEKDNLQKQLEELKEQLKQKDAAFKQERTKLVEENRIALENLKKQKDDAFAKEKSDLEKQFREDLKKQLEQKEAAFKQERTKLVEENRIALENLKKQKDAALDQANTDLKEQLKQKDAAFAKEKSDLTSEVKELQEQLKQLQEEKQQAEQAKQQAEQQVQQEKAKLEGEKAKLQKKFEKQFEEAKSEYENNVAKLKSDHTISKKELEKLLLKNSQLQAKIKELEKILLFDGNRAMVSAALIGGRGDVPLFYHKNKKEDTMFTDLKAAASGYNSTGNIFTKIPELANMVAQRVNEINKTQNEAQYGSVSVLSGDKDGKPVISRLQIGSHPPAYSSTYTEIGLSDGRILRLRDANFGEELDSSLRGIGINIFIVQQDGTEKSMPYDEELQQIFHLPPKRIVEIERDRKIRHEEAISSKRARLADQHIRAEEFRELNRRTPSLVPSR